MSAPVWGWDQVVAVAPKLADAPVPRQTEIISFVQNEVHYDVWGDDQYLAGSIYLAAHLGTLSTMQGFGPVSSQSAGGIAQSYANMLQFGQLALTSFGTEFSRRQRLLTDTFAGIVT